MKKSLLLGIAMAAAMMPAGQTFVLNPRDTDGYSPALGRKKNKPNYAWRCASRRLVNKPKQNRAHKERNKKGRP
jgi:hypothetical protein